MEMSINLNVLDDHKSPLRCEITAVIKNVDKCVARNEELSSEFELLFPDVKWSLTVEKWHGNISHDDFISVCLNCNSDSSNFGCFATINFKLVSQRAGADDINKETSVFYSSVRTYGWSQEFANWKDILNTEKGFLKDGAIILKVELRAEAPYGGCWDSKGKSGYVGFAEYKSSWTDSRVIYPWMTVNRPESSPCVSSVLQMLFFNKKLRNAVYGTPVSSGERTFTLALQKIFNELQVSEKAVNTKEFTKLFVNSKYYTITKVRRECSHDEYVRFIIDSLRRDMRGTKLSNTISNLFEGKLKTVIKCNKVIHVSEAIETFLELTLKVEESSTIYSALKEFVKICKLEGDNLYDAGVHGLQEATKYTSFEKLPSVLHIHLTRPSKRKATTDSSMEFDEEIDLSEFSKSDSDAKYVLHAVLVRSTQRFRTSHFAYISPNVDGLWYRFDNEVVCEVHKSEAIEDNFESVRCGWGRNAIMLVYVKKSEVKDILQPAVRESDVSNIGDCSHKTARLEFPVDFTNFLDSEFLSDISIRVSKFKSYKCHRALLSSDSLFFKTLGVDEKIECDLVVDLREYRLKREAFERVLRYIYGGTCEITVGNVCDVFEVVTLLQIDSIGELCIGFVSKHRNAENMFKMLKIARELRNEHMFEAVSSVIVYDTCFLVDFNVNCLDVDEMRYLLSRGVKLGRNHKYLLESALNWVVGTTNGVHHLSDLLRFIDLRQISIQNIQEICNSQHIANFKRMCNQNFLFVLPLFDRFLSSDYGVEDRDIFDYASYAAIKNYDIGSHVNCVWGGDSEDYSWEIPKKLQISKKFADYSHLLLSEEFSDVTIRVGSDRFNCHRILLAANSPLFANSNFVGSSKKEVDLNVDSEAFAQIIQLIYTGSFEISSKSVIKLANLSFFLQIKFAHEKCVEYATSTMVLENLVDFHLLAYEHEMKELSKITKQIVLANLQYVATMGCLKNTSLEVLRILLEDGEKYVLRPSHLLLAVFKWVMALENRIAYLPELLSVLDLSRMSTPDIRQICNSCTDSDFRLSHPSEMSPISERLLQDEDAAENIRSVKNAIYLATMGENRFYYVVEWNRNFAEDIVKVIPEIGPENSIFDDYGKVDIQIAISGKKRYALMKDKLTKTLHFGELTAKEIESIHFNAICSFENRPIFPEAHRRFPSAVEKVFYVIPGMRNFTVFSDFEKAAFYIYDDAASSWKVHILREQPLFPTFDKLLVAAENELIVLTGESRTDFKLVDLRINSVITIPKPEVSKEDATIALFNHRIYLFSVCNDVRKLAMFDLFTNEWTLLPDAPQVLGLHYGHLQSVGLGNCILVFETRQFEEGQLDEEEEEDDGEDENDDEKDDGTNAEEEEEENEDEGFDIADSLCKCFVHRFDLATREWSSVGEIRGIVLHAIVANAD